MGRVIVPLAGSAQKRARRRRAVVWRALAAETKRERIYFLKVGEAASLLGVSRWTVARLIRDGTLSGSIRIPLEDLKRLTRSPFFPEPCFSITEAARILKVSRATISRFIHGKKLNAFAVRRYPRIARSELVRFKRERARLQRELEERWRS